jgi:hypothetical protein
MGKGHLAGVGNPSGSLVTGMERNAAKTGESPLASQVASDSLCSTKLKEERRNSDSTGRDF